MANIKKSSTLGKSKILSINDSSELTLYPQELRSRFINLKYANVGVKYNHCSVIHKSFNVGVLINQSQMGDLEDYGPVGWFGPDSKPDDCVGHCAQSPGYDMMPDLTTGIRGIDGESGDADYYLNYYNTGQGMEIKGWTYLKTQAHYFRKSVKIISCTFSARINGFDEDSGHLRQDFISYAGSSTKDGLGVKLLIKDSSDTRSFNYGVDGHDDLHAASFQPDLLHDFDASLIGDSHQIRPYAKNTFHKAKLVPKISEFSHSPNSFVFTHIMTPDSPVVVDASSLVCGAVCIGTLEGFGDHGYGSYSNFVGKDFNVCIEYALLE